MAFDLALRDNGAGTFDLTLSVAGGSTTVTPPETAVAVAANDAAVKVTPVAAEAAVAVAAFDATIRVTDVPAEAAVTVTANAEQDSQYAGKHAKREWREWRHINAGFVEAPTKGQVRDQRMMMNFADLHRLP